MYALHCMCQLLFWGIINIMLVIVMCKLFLLTLSLSRYPCNKLCTTFQGLSTSINKLITKSTLLSYEILYCVMEISYVQFSLVGLFLYSSKEISDIGRDKICLIFILKIFYILHIAIYKLSLWKIIMIIITGKMLRRIFSCKGTNFQFWNSGAYAAVNSRHES
jgi:hypothetical protein